MSWNDNVAHANNAFVGLCGKLIKLDMGRHVANYHLDLAQLWLCPVSWCTQWKGMPQDCVAHLRPAHAVPHIMRAANLGKWFPPWTVSWEMWHEALLPQVSGVSTDILLFSERGIPLAHHYQGGGGSAHVSLRGSYMVKIRDFKAQAQAATPWVRHRDSARRAVTTTLAHPRKFGDKMPMSTSPVSNLLGQFLHAIQIL